MLPDYALSKASLYTVARRGSVTRLRIQVDIPQQYQHEPIVTRLIAEHGLTVTVIRALFAVDALQGRLDLQLIGSIAQLQSGLAYLQALNLTIKGKPNADGDSWHH